MARGNDRGGGRGMSGRVAARAAVAAAVSAGLAGVKVARAAPIAWDKGSNTFLWGEAANWNPNQVPTAADDVTFASTATNIFGTINLGNTTREANAVTFAANNTSANYNLSNGTLVTGLIARSSPTQNALLRTTSGTIQSVSLNAPAASGTIAINNTTTTSFFNIQGRVTAATGVTHSGTGRTVLGLTTGLTSAATRPTTS